jgi:hypothetical protein
MTVLNRFQFFVDSMGGLSYGLACILCRLNKNCAAGVSKTAIIVSPRRSHSASSGEIPSAWRRCNGEAGEGQHSTSQLIQHLS